MNAQQMSQAAAAAIRAMSDKDRAAFIALVEAGNGAAADVAKAFAMEGVSRQIRLGSLCMESSRRMELLTEIVGEMV